MSNVVDNSIIIWPPASNGVIFKQDSRISFNAIDIAMPEEALCDYVRSTDILQSIDSLGLKADLMHSRSKYGFVHVSVDRNTCPDSNSYSIHACNQQVAIVGADQLGAVYGLYTFIQMMQQIGTFKTNTDTGSSSVVIPAFSIVDVPDIEQRAVMWSLRQDLHESAVLLNDRIGWLLRSRINTVFLVSQDDACATVDYSDDSVRRSIASFSHQCTAATIKLIPTVILSSIGQMVTTEMFAAFDRASIALVISLDAESVRDELAAKGVSEASMEYESKLLFIGTCESIFKAIQSMGFKYLIISCSHWAKALSDPMVLANKAGLVTEERPFSTMLPAPLLLRKPLLCTTHFIRALRDSAIQSPLAVLPCCSDADAMLPVLLSKYYLSIFAGCAWSKSALPLLINTFEDTPSAISKLVKVLISTIIILASTPQQQQQVSSKAPPAYTTSSSSHHRHHQQQQHYLQAVVSVVSGEAVRSVLGSRSRASNVQIDEQCQLSMEDLLRVERMAWQQFTAVPGAAATDQYMLLSAADQPSKLSVAACLNVCSKIIATAQWKVTGCRWTRSCSPLLDSTSCLSMCDELFWALNTLSAICRALLMGELTSTGPAGHSIIIPTALRAKKTVVNVSTGFEGGPHSCKRAAIFDRIDMDLKPVSFAKDERVVEIILRALESSALFKNYKLLGRLLVEGFERVDAVAGEVVVQQHDMGDFFYIIQSGRADIHMQSDGYSIKLGTLGSGEFFGELALLYNTPRAATVMCIESTILWRISRQNYRAIVAQNSAKTAIHYVSLISNVEILGKRFGDVLSAKELHKVVSSVEVEVFEHDTVIVRQFTTADYFYIIVEGHVEVWRDGTSDGRKRLSIQQGLDVDGKALSKDCYGSKVTVLSEGCYFGEKALLGDDERQASCLAIGKVTCLSLSRDDFTGMLGRFQDLKADLSSRPEEAVTAVAEAHSVLELVDAAVDDFQPLALLGTGAFGRVTLVRHRVTGVEYALKIQDKDSIVEQGMQKMLESELSIMKMVRHPCIAQLYGFMQDAKHIYMVLELLSGGEFFSYLQSCGRLPEEVARFYSASVLCAFEELHRHLIAYRDLKPENMVLDCRGYVKLVDLGLAKQIVDGTTWTMAGTPEYLAPEIVLNKGHNHAVDYWALGVLLFEMLHGQPPFFHEDPMKIYTKIISGKINYPDGMFSAVSEDLVSRLCTKVPSKRLGNMKGGIMDVKKHKFFGPFNWMGLLSGSIQPPFVPDGRPGGQKPSYLDDYVPRTATDSDWFVQLE